MKRFAALATFGILSAPVAVGVSVAQQRSLQDEGNASADLGLIVELRGVNKVTGETDTVEVETGIAQQFGNLLITAYSCQKAPPTERPESVAFLQIDELTAQSGSTETRTRVFSGWMFASTPALNALEHPVYDLWVTDCRTAEGLASSGSR